MTPAHGGGRTPWAPPTLALNGPSASPMLQIGFLCFCFYVFAYHSRILDLGLESLHLPGIALGVTIGVAVLSGRIAQGLQSRIGVCMAGLTVWLVISIPGAYWRRGSLDVLTGSWLPTLLLFLAGGAVITTASQCRRALWVLGLATATGAMIVTFGGVALHGRLLLAGTGYQNSNMIAIMLLLGMPMVWLLAAGPRAGKARQALVGGVLILMVVAVLRTGSREGLIGMAALCATAFVQSRAIGRLAIAVSVVVLALTSLLFLPQSVKARLGTIFGPESMDFESEEAATEWGVTTSAAASSQSRLKLLKDSLAVTASHPLLGVGPGNFAPYCAAKEKEEARPGLSLWVGTHNTYTQLSAELGIPGLIFYLGVLVASLGTLRRIYLRARRIPGNQGRDISYMAVALHTSFIVFCVTAFFNHMAYGTVMPLMAAIAVAMSKTAPNELKRLEEAARDSNATGDSNFPRANQISTKPGVRLERAR